jgi:hypothetical protein
MNTFDYLEEMEQTIQDKMNSTDDTARMFVKNHYQEMLNMLTILKTEMEMAEYHYVVESLQNEVHTFEEFTVLQKHLNDDLILIQPIALGEAELSMIDMQSLCDILKQARDKGIITENIVVLPPNINVFKAKLAPQSEK